MNIIGKTLNNLPRKKKSILVVFNDFLLAFLCWLVFGPPMATALSSNFSGSLLMLVKEQIYSFIIPAIIFTTYFSFLGYYRSLIRYFDSRDSIFICVSGSLIFGLSWAAIYIMQFPLISASFLSIIILQALLLSAVLYAFLNISRDVAQYFLYPAQKDDNASPVVIFGSDGSANELMLAIQNDSSKRIIALFDDSPTFSNLRINNIPIISSFDRLLQFKSTYPDLQVLLALPNTKTQHRRRIISELEKIKVSVRTLPTLNELISNQKKATDVQELSIDDILPGARISNAKVENAESKTFFISGAGGSIGSEITRQLLANKPKEIILFEVSEYNLFIIERECLAIKASKKLDTKIIPILGDIRDKNNLEYIFKKYPIDHIYHAAAYKHVPLVENEDNISKSAENNIIGTLNLAETAIAFNIDSFVMISTDKAVRPTNIMGATKRFAEIVIQSLNDQTTHTKFCMVRFGNVINSSGSVIPLFVEQIAKGGPVTVTHKEVMRYFMTIPEASNLVLQAGEMSLGGEVFILDMGEQIKIYDLARKLIHLSGRDHLEDNAVDGIEILEVGLRPGEKMYEELLISGNEIKTANPKIFKAIESFMKASDLIPLLLDLKTAISNYDNTKIIKLLSQHVEGFDR